MSVFKLFIFIGVIIGFHFIENTNAAPGFYHHERALKKADIIRALLNSFKPVQREELRSIANKISKDRSTYQIESDSSQFESDSSSRNLWSDDAENITPEVQKFLSQPMTYLNECQDIEKSSFCTDFGKTFKDDEIGASFKSLLSCYNETYGVASCADENDRKDSFLKDFLDSKVGENFKKVVLSVDKTDPKFDEKVKALQALLKEIWFGPQNGFRHVFRGEIKTDRRGRRLVKGFHNWFEFYNEMCVKKQIVLSDEDTKNFKICGFGFTWHLATKRKSTILFGSDPYLDFAIDSLCFLKLGRKEGVCTIQFNGATFQLQMFGDDDKITTAYFII